MCFNVPVGIFIYFSGDRFKVINLLVVGTLCGSENHYLSMFGQWKSLLGCVPEFQVKYSIQFWANTIGMVWFGGCNSGLHLSVWFAMDIASLLFEYDFRFGKSLGCLVEVHTELYCVAVYVLYILLTELLEFL